MEESQRAPMALAEVGFSAPHRPLLKAGKQLKGPSWYGMQGSRGGKVLRGGGRDLGRGGKEGREGGILVVGLAPRGSSGSGLEGRVIKVIDKSFYTESGDPRYGLEHYLPG